MLVAFSKHCLTRVSTICLLLLSLLAPLASLSWTSVASTCTMKCCKTAKASSCHRVSHTTQGKTQLHALPDCKGQCCAQLAAPVLPLLLAEQTSTAAFLASLPALRLTPARQTPHKESLPRHRYQRPPPTLS